MPISKIFHLYNTAKVPAIFQYILFVAAGVKAMDLRPSHLWASLHYGLKMYLRFPIELFLLFCRTGWETFIPSGALGSHAQNVLGFRSAWGVPSCPLSGLEGQVREATAKICFGRLINTSGAWQTELSRVELRHLNSRAFSVCFVWLGFTSLYGRTILCLTLIFFFYMWNVFDHIIWSCHHTPNSCNFCACSCGAHL